MTDLTALPLADLSVLANAIDDEIHKRGSASSMAHIAKGKCRASLGKRKVNSLTVDTRPADMTATVVAYWSASWEGVQITANCWIKDANGREFGLVLGHDLLAEIVGSYHHIAAASRQTEARL